MHERMSKSVSTAPYLRDGAGTQSIASGNNMYRRVHLIFLGEQNATQMFFVDSWSIAYGFQHTKNLGKSLVVKYVFWGKKEN